MIINTAIAGSSLDVALAAYKMLSPLAVQLDSAQTKLLQSFCITQLQAQVEALNQKLIAQSPVKLVELKIIKHSCSLIFKFNNVVSLAGNLQLLQTCFNCINCIAFDSEQS